MDTQQSGENGSCKWKEKDEKETQRDSELENVDSEQHMLRLNNVMFTEGLISQPLKQMFSLEIWSDYEKNRKKTSASTLLTKKISFI